MPVAHFKTKLNYKRSAAVPSSPVPDPRGLPSTSTHRKLHPAPKKRAGSLVPRSRPSARSGPDCKSLGESLGLGQEVEDPVSCALRWDVLRAWCPCPQRRRWQGWERLSPRDPHLPTLPTPLRPGPHALRWLPSASPTGTRAPLHGRGEVGARPAQAGPARLASTGLEIRAWKALKLRSIGIGSGDALRGGLGAPDRPRQPSRARGDTPRSPRRVERRRGGLPGLLAPPRVPAPSPGWGSWTRRRAPKKLPKPGPGRGAAEPLATDPSRHVTRSSSLPPQRPRPAASCSCRGTRARRPRPTPRRAPASAGR